MPNKVTLKKQYGPNIDLERLQQYTQEAIRSVPSAGTAASSSSAYTLISGPRYVVQPTDFWLSFDPTNFAIAVTLPPAKNGTQTLILKDCTGQSGNHNIVVKVGLGIDTIDGSAFATLLTPYDRLRLRSDGIKRWMVW
jgi:hypothetical protein